MFLEIAVEGKVAAALLLDRTSIPADQIVHQQGRNRRPLGVVLATSSRGGAVAQLALVNRLLTKRVR
jgi:hypothetical protein